MRLEAFQVSSWSCIMRWVSRAEGSDVSDALGQGGEVCLPPGSPQCDMGQHQDQGPPVHMASPLASCSLVLIKREIKLLAGV